MKVSVEATKIKSETPKAFFIRLDGEQERFIWFPKKFCRFSGVNSFTVKMWSPDGFGYDIVKQNGDLIEKEVTLNNCFPDRVYKQPSKKKAVKTA